MIALVLCLVAICPAPSRGGHAEVVPPARGGQSMLVMHVRELERFDNWVCIHRHEGAWNDRGDPYWGGLQMDRGFMRSYGSDFIRKHQGGLADTWTPAEQIVAAERAYRSGRGFGPWPNTARDCGLPTSGVGREPNLPDRLHLG